MSPIATTTTHRPVPARGANEAARLLTELQFAQVQVTTRRQVTGRDMDDPGMRDFTASLTTYFGMDEVGTDDLPAWVADVSWANVPLQDKLELLAHISPLLAEIALDVTSDDYGMSVELVRVTGSIVNPFRLRGTLDEALEARSPTLAAFSRAFGPCPYFGDTHIALKDSLGVEGVGNVTLLSGVQSSRRLQAVADGLEAALVSQVLQDVTEGSGAVLALVGKLPTDRAEKAYLRNFWSNMTFSSWKHGIWAADTGTKAFEDASKSLDNLVG